MRAGFDLLDVRPIDVDRAELASVIDAQNALQFEARAGRDGAGFDLPDVR